MNKKYLVTLSILLLDLALAGCGTDGHGAEGPDSSVARSFIITANAKFQHTHQQLRVTAKDFSVDAHIVCNYRNGKTQEFDQTLGHLGGLLPDTDSQKSGSMSAIINLPAQNIPTDGLQNIVVTVVMVVSIGHRQTQEHLNYDAPISPEKLEIAPPIILSAKNGWSVHGLSSSKIGGGILRELSDVNIHPTRS